MGNLAMIEAKFQALSGRLDEAALRMWAATEARSLGRGGVSAVAKDANLLRDLDALAEPTSRGDPMGPEYSCALRPELARSWSAASHRRFSSKVEAASFTEGAIHCMRLILSVAGDGQNIRWSYWRSVIV